MSNQGQDGGGSVYLRAGLDVSGVEQGAQQAKAAVKDMATSVVNDTAAAGKSLSTLGGANVNVERITAAFSGVNDSVKKMVSEGGRSLQSWVSQVENTAAKTNKVTQEMADNYEAKAIRKGYDPAVFQPYIAALRQLAAENQRVAEVAAYESGEQKKANIERAKAAAVFDNFQRSAQAARIELLSFGKTAAEKYQIRAEILGIDKNAAVQEIHKQLVEAQKVADAAAASVNDKIVPATNAAGMSAKAYSAALRQVPAQLTDIVVGLQGGQAPMTVLLQQGGQLKDVFGGVGNAARAMGSYLLSLINPYTVLAAAAATLAVAHSEGAAEMRAFNTALTTSGNRLGETAGQLNSTAAAMANFGTTQGKAAETLAAFANSGVQGGQALREASEAAIAWEKATGESIDKTVAKYADLRKTPLETTLKLNESLGYVTTSLYQQIKALEDQGKATQAADLAQKAFADTLKSRSDEMLQNLGWIERAWNGIKDAAKGAWDAAKGIGRSTTLEDQVAALTKKRDQYKANGYNTTAEDEQLAALTKRLMLQRDSAQLQAQELARAESLAKWDKDGVSYLAKKARMELEIKKTREEGRDAGVKEEEIEKRILAIREKYAEKGKTAAIPKLTEVDRAYLSSMEELGRLQLQAQAKTENLSKAQEALRKVMGSPEWAQFTFRKQEELILAASLAQASEDEADAKKKVEAAIKAQTAERDAEVKKITESATSMVQKAQAMEDEVALYGQSEEAIKNLTIARLREEQAKQMSYGDEKMVAALQAEIDAIKRLAKAKDALDDKKAASKAAEQAAADWKRAAEKIESSITDALMRAFEAGKSFGEAMRDVIVNMFKTMVLRPVVQATVAGALSTVGLNAAANTVSGGSSGGGLGGFNPIGSIANHFLGSVEIGGASLSALGSSFTTGITAGFNGTSLAGAIEAYSAASMEGVASMLSLGESIGGFAAALGPVGLAVGGIALLAALFGGGGRYVKSTGETTLGFDPQGNRTYTGDYRYDYANNAGANNLVTELNKTYLNTAKKLGINAVRTSFGYGGNDAESQSGNGKFRLGSSAGTDNITGTVRRQFDSGEIDNAKGALELAASRAVLTALTGSDLPKYLTGYLDQITVAQIGSMTEEQIAAVMTAAQSYQELNAAITALPFANLKDQTYTVYKALIDTAGGMQQFSQNLNSFYSNFYSAEEQKAQVVKNINAAISAAGSSIDVSAFTRAQYRALVESQDLTTESGRALYSALIANAGAFAQITQASTTASTAITDTAKLMADAAKALEDAQKSVHDAQQALVDYGNTLRDNLNATNSSINDLRGQARESVSAAQQAVMSAIGALAEYGKQVADQIKATEDSINTIRGQARDNALAAERSYTDALANLLDKKTAAQDAFTASIEKLATVMQAASDRVTNAGKNVDTARAEITSKYIAAQQRVEDLQRSIADGLRSSAKSIGDWLDNITGKAAGLTQGGSLGAQRGSFDALVAAARGGDATAAAALPGAADKYLQAAQDQSRTQAEFLAEQTRVRQQLYAVQSAIGASAGTSTNTQADQLAAALEELRKMAAAVAASGASTTATQDVLANYNAAVRELETATADYNRMVAGAAAAGLNVRLNEVVDSFAQALADAQQAQQNQTAAANAYATALQRAAELGVTIGASVTPLQASIDAVATAAQNYADASAAALEVNSALYTAQGSLVEQYHTLQTTLAEQQAAQTSAAESYARAVEAIRALGVILAEESDPLTTAVQAVTSAMQTLADANATAVAVGASMYEAQAGIQEQYAELSLKLKEQRGQLDAYLLATTGPLLGFKSDAVSLGSLLTQYAAAVTALRNAQTVYGAGGEAAGAKLYSIADVVGHVQNALSAGYSVADTISGIGKNLGISEADIRKYAREAGIPGFAVGTNYVPQDMLAMVHQGEAIVPAQFNPSVFSKAANDDLIIEVRALREEVKSLREANSAENTAIATSTNKTAKLLSNVTQDGDAMQTRVAA